MNITAEASNVAGVTFAQNSFGNGHLAIFYVRMTLSDRVTGCSLIRYEREGASAPDVWMYAATYATFTSGNNVIDDRSMIQDGGPRGLKIFGLFYESHGHGDLVSIAASGGPGKYFHVDIFGVKCVVDPAFVNRWIVNRNSTWVGPNNHLLIQGGSIDAGGGTPSMPLGMPGQSGNFRILIRGVVGFNPKGIATVTPGPSPWTYTNEDGVDEIVYVNGGIVSDISKNGNSIFSSTGKSIYLEPGESVTIGYSSIPIFKVDRR